MTTIGVLLNIGQGDTEGLVTTTEAHDVTLEQALEHVRASEAANIGFDAAGTVGDEAEHWKARAAAAAAMTWPEAANENGQYELSSVWCGGIDEDGMEWRFVPVREAA